MSSGHVGKVVGVNLEKSPVVFKKSLEAGLRNSVVEKEGNFAGAKLEKI